MKIWPTGRRPDELMRKLYGSGEGTCKTCKHFERHGAGRSGKWFKCGLQMPSGPAGDWRAGWLACGRKEPKP